MSLSEDELNDAALLHDHVEKGLFDQVEKMLQKGCNPNKLHPTLESPLIPAVKNKNMSMVKLLLIYGANPSIGRDSALDMAIAFYETRKGAGANDEQLIVPKEIIELLRISENNIYNH
jgi:ankyrin repeat protein